MDDALFLPGLPAELIRAAYLTAPGNEIESGKFASQASSAALVANTFGLFIGDPATMPSLPGVQDCGWPAKSLALEATVRFPWQGGRHPCLDVLITTTNALIGVESKRYEPFRTKAAPDNLSNAYWRAAWGSKMAGYERCRDGLRNGSIRFDRLDAAQLIKHAFALRTAVQPKAIYASHRPVLFYLYAEPEHWPGETRSVPIEDRVTHRNEISAFSNLVAEDEVTFRATSYSELLADWLDGSSNLIRAHAVAVADRFSIKITSRNP